MYNVWKFPAPQRVSHQDGIHREHRWLDCRNPKERQASEHKVRVVEQREVNGRERADCIHKEGRIPKETVRIESLIRTARISLHKTLHKREKCFYKEVAAGPD